MSNLILNAANLADMCYDLPHNGNRQILNKWNTDQWESAEGEICDLNSIRIPLQYNLLGESGNCTVLVTRAAGKLYIAIEGTDDIETWLYNLNRESAMFNGWIRLHRGFLDYASGVRDYLMSDPWFRSQLHSFSRNIICCGHSAGGAAASILPFLILKELEGTVTPRESVANKPSYWQVIDFGSPPIWKAGNVQTIDPTVGRLRFEHYDDIVPALLRFRGYNHYGQGYYLPPKGKWYLTAHNKPSGLYWRKWSKLLWNSMKQKSIIEAVSRPHSMGTYLNIVERMLEGGEV